jgi:SdpC family antimicrobial peptide
LKLTAGAIVASALAIGGGMLLVSHEDIGTVQVRSVAMNEKLTGGEFFQAIVFGQGDLARKIGENPSESGFYAAEYSAHNLPRNMRTAGDIVRDISARDPGYFSNFADKIQSGNPYWVAAVIDSVGQALRAGGALMGDADYRSVDPVAALNSGTMVYTDTNTHVNVLDANLIVTKGAQAAAVADGLARDQAVADITTTFRSV